MKIETVANALDVAVLANVAGDISDKLAERNVGLILDGGTLVVVALADRDKVGVRTVVGVTVEEKSRVVTVKPSAIPKATITSTINENMSRAYGDPRDRGL